MHTCLLSRLLKLQSLGTRTNLSHVRCFQKNFQPFGCDSGAYAGDGKTTAKVINDEDTGLNLISAYSASGFRLANNLRVKGPVLIFPTCIYAWNIKRGIDITPESLIVFDLIVPKIKMLIIGYGEPGEPYDLKLAANLKKKGISCEVLATPDACTTYNYLVYDSVHVAAALVPVRNHPVIRSIDGALDSHDYAYKELQYNPRFNYIRDSDEYYDKIKPHIERDKGKKKFDE